MAIQESGEARTAAMRSTSNRLLRIKQASASSILEGVSTACSIGSAGERGGERENWGSHETQEGGCCHVIEREDKRGKKWDNRTTNVPMCLSSPRHLKMR